MYQPTTAEMTDYENFLDHSSYMYGGSCMGPYANRRSNSRSGYRLFARVSHKGSGANSRMPPRESVYAFFSQFGVVMDCYLPESATNVAYLCFEDENTMEHVLAMPEHHLCVEGVYVTLSRASPRPDYSMNETDRVFVKNVPESTTRTALRNYFSQFGLVTDVYIPKDKVTGEQKKFAFVTFAGVDAARSAISHGDTHRLVYIDRMTSMLTTAALQVMPAEPRPVTATPQCRPYMWKDEVSDDAFTTASSTMANTPTSGGGMSVEAAASVLINALSQLAETNGSPLSESASNTSSELDDILAKLTSLSLTEPSVTPGLEAPAGSPTEADASVLTQLIEETLSRQSSAAAEMNIFEHFLNPSWETREA